MSRLGTNARRRIRGLALVAALIGTASALSGCVLVGDSVSSFMVPDLHKVVPIVDADFGRSLDLHGWQTQESGIQAIRRWEGLKPPWIILQLGANDVNATGDTTMWRASIRAALAPIPPAQCVGWVLVYDTRQPGRSEQFDAIVAQEMARAHPKRVLIPWPDEVKRGGMLIDDVHLSPLGKATMTRLVAQAVSTFGHLGCG
jgi:lysophospholipase L1-like esterase